MILKINNRAFNAIKNGTKTTEIRANKGKAYIIGDTITFLNTSTLECLKCIIKDVKLYSTVR